MIFAVSDDRLPTYLWLEAKIRELTARGQGVYVTRRGDAANGMVLLKIADMTGRCRLLTRQRDLDGVLQWVNVLSDERPDERAADDYVRRAVGIDPDLWVIEVEDRELANPFIFKETP